MSSIRILHVASFAGNIGDNASHIGFTKILGRFFPKISEERLEIRRFYMNYCLPDKLYFDESFVRMANTFDLLVIGGGGFLDYWVPNSATGTTIDMSRDIFDKLKVPTLMCSIGCIPHREVPDGNEEKFKSFLTQALSKKNVRILLRNDGSKEVLDNIAISGEFDSISTILDNGFFFDINDENHFDILNDKYIAINSTLDQLEMNSHLNGQVDKELISKELGEFILSIIEKTDYHIVMVPHIYADIKAFQILLKDINDFCIRTRIHIAPYTHGDYGCRLLFSIYKNADYCVGMRFHANVCNLAMNKPVSGLAVLDRIKHVHDYVGNSNSVVDVNGSFSPTLFQMTMENAGKELPKNVWLNIEKAKVDSLGKYEQSLSEIL